MPAPATGPIGPDLSAPIDDRWLEDYLPGAVHRFGSIAVSEDEIIAFARQFDPQRFHVDPVAAEASPYGGLIASGWHTASITMRLLADHVISHVGGIGSPGVDALRWLAPVRPGDALDVRFAVAEARPSRPRPGQGVVLGRVETLVGETAVMTFDCVILMLARPAA